MPTKPPTVCAVTDAPRRLTSKPTYLTTQLATHARRLVTEAFDRAGARGYHYRLLSALEEAGPQSQAELGRGVNVDRSDVVAAVNQLVELGHVERRADPTDARRWIVHLTPAGSRQLRRLDRELAIAQAEFTAPLTAKERAEYQRLLSRLLAHHEAARSGSAG
jgi:MarR family transcriptional regulator, lower aerobic nicotinate degradation pathway regulator